MARDRNGQSSVSRCKSKEQKSTTSRYRGCHCSRKPVSVGGITGFGEIRTNTNVPPANTRAEQRGNPPVDDLEANYVRSTWGPTNPDHRLLLLSVPSAEENNDRPVIAKRVTARPTLPKAPRFSRNAQTGSREFFLSVSQPRPPPKPRIFTALATAPRSHGRVSEISAAVSVREALFARQRGVTSKIPPVSIGDFQEPPNRTDRPSL